MAKAVVSTRSATKHYVFGHCGPMNKNQLPLCIDIIRHLYYLKYKDTRQRTSPADYFEQISKELKDIARIHFEDPQPPKILTKIKVQYISG